MDALLHALDAERERLRLEVLGERYHPQRLRRLSTTDTLDRQHERRRALLLALDGTDAEADNF